MAFTCDSCSGSASSTVNWSSSWGTYRMSPASPIAAMRARVSASSSSSRARSGSSTSTEPFFVLGLILRRMAARTVRFPMFCMLSYLGIGPVGRSNNSTYTQWMWRPLRRTDHRSGAEAPDRQSCGERLQPAARELHLVAVDGQHLDADVVAALDGVRRQTPQLVEAEEPDQAVLQLQLEAVLVAPDGRRLEGAVAVGVELRQVGPALR